MPTSGLLTWVDRPIPLLTEQHGENTKAAVSISCLAPFPSDRTRTLSMRSALGFSQVVKHRLALCGRNLL
jgi:hypothetical protein